jgi:hypothetical protein
LGEGGSEHRYDQDGGGEEACHQRSGFMTVN